MRKLWINFPSENFHCSSRRQFSLAIFKSLCVRKFASCRKLFLSPWISHTWRTSTRRKVFVGVNSLLEKFVSGEQEEIRIKVWQQKKVLLSSFVKVITESFSRESTNQIFLQKLSKTWRLSVDDKICPKEIIQQKYFRGGSNISAEVCVQKSCERKPCSTK